MLDDVLTQPAEIAAKNLLGSYLVRYIDGQEIIAKIVETEAYSQSDEASHTFRGSTNRTKVMFGPPGFAYVYFTYGMHYCLNVVCEVEGQGAAVLIRAIEPVSGLSVIRKNRPGILRDLDLTNGPAKLTKALLIDKSFYGHDLSKKPLILDLKALPIGSKIVSTKRIGISKNKDLLWRFYLKDNPYVSVL